MANLNKSIAIFNWRHPKDPKAGGAERVTLKHAEAWVQNGYQVTWISASYPGSSQDSTEKGIRYLCSGRSSLFFLWAWWVYLTKLSPKPAIVIDQVHGLPLFAPIWAYASKVLCFIHELAGDIWDEMYPFPINAIGRTIERHVFPRVYKKTNIWVDSRSTSEELQSIGFVRKNVAVIPCAIDAQPLKKGQKEDVLSLVFLSRIVKMKGIEFALEVFEQVWQKEPRAKLHVVGSGDKTYVTQIQQFTQNKAYRNSVIFHGRVSEDKKYELLRRAHFLLHTSIKEGFGLTVLEANSQQTPAVVFSVASLKELVTDGETGVVAEFPNTAKLADNIITIFRDQKKYSRIAQNAFEYQKSFRWPEFTKQSIKLLESL